MTDQERCIDALRKISGNTDPGITFPGLLANALEKLAEGGDEPPVQEVFVVEYRTSGYDPSYLECDISYGTIRDKINELGPNNVIAKWNRDVYRLATPVRMDPSASWPIVFSSVSVPSGYGTGAISSITHTLSEQIRISNIYNGPIGYFNPVSKSTINTADEIYSKYCRNSGISFLRSNGIGEFKEGTDIIIVGMSRSANNTITMCYTVTSSNRAVNKYATANQINYFTNLF